MDFNWNAAEKQSRAGVAALFDREATGELDRMEEEDLADLRDTNLRWLGRLAKVGYLEPERDELAAEQAMLVQTTREAVASAASSSLFLSVETSARLFGGLIARHGGEELKAELLGPLGRGELVGAVAAAEPSGEERGWQTEGVPGEGGYTLNGHKSFVTNAPIADRIAIVGAVQEETAVFIVKPKDPGVTVGPRIRTMGHQGLAVAALELQGVKVPARNVLGPFGDGLALARLRRTEDLILAIASVGLAERSLDAAKRHAKSHHRGGKAIGKRQEVRFKVAEMLTWVQTATWLVRRAVWACSTAQAEAGVLLRCAKVFCAEAAEAVSGSALQIGAGHGYVWGTTEERSYREARLAAIAGTTSEVARMEIADELLARY